MFDSGNCELAEQRDLSAVERKRIAQDHFDEWFYSANEFFIDYNNAFARESYKKAAFYLHQAAESAYKSVLLVFSNHCPCEQFPRLPRIPRRKIPQTNVQHLHQHLKRRPSQIQTPRIRLHRRKI